jgi:long-chain acyl-CoA synthetase
MMRWRWVPVRGEYEAGDPPQRCGTGEISAIDTFTNRTMFVLGGTGFLGKVFIAMVLDRFPEIRRLIVQVRRRKNLSGEQRFFTEVLQTPPLRDIVKRIGGEDAVRRKVSVVEGDLEEPFCGLDREQIGLLKEQIDIVVNLAGLVDFDPPLNESLRTNVYGTQHVLDLVRLLDAKLVHVSTSYVTGKRDGRISEDIPIDGFWPRQGQHQSEKFSLVNELKWCERFIEETRDRDQLREGGMRRAEHWGWINTYTYAKSMGEQIIAQTSGLRYAIVRPAIVESALQFPFPGWNEGFTTSAPLVLMGGDGVKGWPVREDGPLEIIPVDLVAAGILIVAAAVLSGKNRPVYHLASAEENPLMYWRLVAFFGMNARCKHKHSKDGSRLANLWKAYANTRAVTIEALRVRQARLRRSLDATQAGLTLAKRVLGARKVDPYLKALRRTRRQIRTQEGLMDTYLPFLLHHSFVFETRNIREAARMLTAEDLKRLRWEPETIDWADYWVNVHTKGIEKWIRPNLVGRLKQEAGL